MDYTKETQLIAELRQMAADAQSRGTLMMDTANRLLERAAQLNWNADRLEAALLLS